MKKLIPMLAFLLAASIFVFTGCGNIPSKAPTPTPSPSPGSEQEEETEKPEGGFSGPVKAGQEEGQPSDEPTPAETDKRSTTYGPSIFIIEASGSWEQEIEKGYRVNYECELYLDKIEPHNMHDDNGAYTGVFWLKLTVDASEFISQMTKNVPFMNFNLDVEAEGLNDSVTFYLRDGYTRDPTASFDIPDEQGGSIKPDHNALAGKGSFVVSPTYGNLDIQVVDTQKGITMGQQQSGGGSDTEVSYVVHVAPDPTGDATERDVKIYIMLADGSSTVLDGKWHRLPGYPEDLEKYYNSGKSREILERHQ
ncbi:MAG: hypothetical protein ACOX22_08855 [Caldicoprobacterales bacterium]|jgi:hypothetical protein